MISRREGGGGRVVMAGYAPFGNAIGYICTRRDA